jgi:AraC-like DNA-binding protein
MTKYVHEACQLVHVPLRQDLQDDFAISTPHTYYLPAGKDPISLLQSHDVLEIGYCFAGTGILVVEDRVFHFQPGDASIVGPGEMHMSRRPEEVYCEWAYFWVDPVRLIGAAAFEPEIFSTDRLGGPGFPNILSCRKYPEITSLIRDIVQELQQEKTEYRALVRGEVWTLLSRLYRLRAELPAQTQEASSGDVERIASALQYMASHYAEPLTLEDLAGTCHLSLTHFRRLFCGAVGVPPMRYLAQLRIRMAAAMLRGTSLPVIEVAWAVGYSALNTFNRHFLAFMEMTPRQWRHSNQSKQ